MRNHRGCRLAGTAAAPLLKCPTLATLTTFTASGRENTLIQILRGYGVIEVSQFNPPAMLTIIANSPSLLPAALTALRLDLYSHIVTQFDRFKSLSSQSPSSEPCACMLLKGRSTIARPRPSMSPAHCFTAVVSRPVLLVCVPLDL